MTQDERKGGSPVEILRHAVEVMLPMVEEASYDHHTAGMLPGAGYNHRVYAEISKVFGWRNTSAFDDFKRQVETALSQIDESATEQTMKTQGNKNA